MGERSKLRAEAESGADKTSSSHPSSWPQWLLLAGMALAAGVGGYYSFWLIRPADRTPPSVTQRPEPAPSWEKTPVAVAEVPRRPPSPPRRVGVTPSEEVNLDRLPDPASPRMTMGLPCARAVASASSEL